MSPILVQILKWAIEKAALEAGKEVDWSKVKAAVELKIDALIPNYFAEKVATYMVNEIVDIVANYFATTQTPVTPSTVSQAVDQAKESLIGKVVLELLDLKK